MAKKSDKKDGKKERKASAKSDRELLELGEDLLMPSRTTRSGPRSPRRTPIWSRPPETWWPASQAGSWSSPVRTPGGGSAR